VFFVDVFASGSGLDVPDSLLFGPDDNLYVTSNGSDQVLRFNGATGAFMDVFAAFGRDGLVFGQDGNLYLSGSHASNDVRRFNGTTGAFIDTFISAGSGGLSNAAHMTFFPVPEPSTLEIDIKPGSDPNSVNLNSRGVLPVALLGTNEFDIMDVVIESLLFGDPALIDVGGSPVAPIRYSYEDVTGDGLPDLSMKFKIPAMIDNEVLGTLTTEGLLTGMLIDSTEFMGSDTIRIVGPSSVPEPTTMSMLMLAGLALLSVIGRR